MRKKKISMVYRIAYRDLLANRGRNIFLLTAIFITTFMTATILSLCVNQIEKQSLYISENMVAESNGFDPIIHVLVLVCILVVVAGLLFIYNVMSIFVTKEIRFFGSLQAIGASKKQIIKIMSWQMILLCTIGIPVGIAFSILTNLAIVPMFLSMYPDIYEKGDAIILHPIIFIVSFVLTFLTVMAGALIPAKKAAKVSPIEAIRTEEYGYNARKVRRSKFSLLKMAWRNVFRKPTRTCLVFCSLFLGMTVYLIVSTIVGSASIDMFTQEASRNIDGDIYLRNDKADLYTLGEENGLKVFDQKLQNQLKHVSGVTKVHTTYVHEIKMNVTDEEGEVHEYPGYVYGVDSYEFAKLKNELTDSFDEKQFENGDSVFVRNIWKQPELNTGSIEFKLEGVGNPVVYSVAGVLPSEFADYYGTRYNRLPCIYMSAQLLKQLVGEPAVYDMALNIEESEHNQALRTVKNLILGKEHIILQSQIAIRNEAQNIVTMLTVIGSGIAAILWFVGILNFVNVISTSILSRRHEIALLESVGQSKRQTKKTLTFEGMFYALGTLALVGTIGTLIVSGIFQSMRSQFDYMVLKLPMIPFLIMIVLILGVCSAIPQLVYHLVSKESITDRLKENE